MKLLITKFSIELVKCADSIYHSKKYCKENLKDKALKTMWRINIWILSSWLSSSSNLDYGKASKSIKFIEPVSWFSISSLAFWRPSDGPSIDAGKHARPSSRSVDTEPRAANLTNVQIWFNLYQIYQFWLTQLCLIFMVEILFSYKMLEF